MPRMHIAHIAAEMAPLVKVGGLGDVLGALPAAQAREGHQVSVVLPGYARLLGSRRDDTRTTRPVSFEIDGQPVGGTVHTISEQGVTVLLLEQQAFFSRDGVYGDEHGSYGDNGLRFGWFAGAALNALRETVPAPDVVVAHDWPAALAPVLMRAQPLELGPLEDAASALVIHNLAHQGHFPRELAGRLGIAELFLDLDALWFRGAISMLRGGIRCATVVITVSPTYAREIVWPPGGEGLDQDLLARGGELIGILNGIDTHCWDPANDPHLPLPYGAGSPTGKSFCKTALQTEMGLRSRADLPLFGVVSRLDPQKGLDLLAPVAPRLIEREAQLVVLGSGQRQLIEPLRGLAELWRESVAIVERFDEPLAHRIYAGADFFLMPSRFEPCGLGQLVALRYGTVPIVRRTGGLADTVRDIDEHPDDGTGIVFEHADAAGLTWACERALKLFHGPAVRLDEIRRRALREDFSWDRSAAVYEAVLERAIRSERQRVFAR